MKQVADWLKKRIPADSKFNNTFNVISEFKLNTVCKSAKCPNIIDCFGKGIATFLILGNTCTRHCSFCNIGKGIPDNVDLNEPVKIAAAVEKLQLKHVVITSVTRDDLFDKGAIQFNKTINAIRRLNKEIKIEVLTPDFCGEKEAIDIVLSAKPDIYNHNLETVPRLYPLVRIGADYSMSINLLEYVKKTVNIPTKSGIMLGIGETEEEVISLMEDLRKVNCDMLTIGQYLRPSEKNIPVHQFIKPEKFNMFKDIALNMGFSDVVSMPFARSSLNIEVINN